MRFYINNRGTFGVSFSTRRRKKGGGPWGGIIMIIIVLALIGKCSESSASTLNYDAVSVSP